MAALNDFIPVSMSGREEDLKIALHSLAGKANKSHSSLLGHSRCPEVRELCFEVSVMFYSALYQIKSVTNLMGASKRSDSQTLTHIWHFRGASVGLKVSCTASAFFMLMRLQQQGPFGGER